MRFRGAAKGVSKIFAAEIMILFASVIACVLYALITIAGGIDSINLEGEPDSSVIAIVVCSIAVGVLILLAGLFKIIGTVFSLNISMIILGHVFKLFMNETTITTISTIVAVIILVLTVIAYILYLGYLGKASRMLKNER